MIKKTINIIKHIVVFIILLFSYTLAFSMNWVFKNFGNIGLEEIMFQINVPLTNANTDYYYDYAQNALPYILLCTIMTFILICFIFKKRVKKIYPKRMKGVNEKKLIVYKKCKIDKKYIGKLISSLIVLMISITYTIQKIDLIQYVRQILSESTLIKNEYIDTRDVNLLFPETKRNLIYIYLESMEATFYSKESGGAFEDSLIEDLEELAKENIMFSNSDTFKGLYVLPGATWTTGAMTAQTLGLPLKIPIDRNSYGDYNSFLPGTMGLGDILKQQGYNQMLAIGSRAEFGGRNHLFKEHGDYQIFDFNQAIKEEKKDEGDFVWWGFPDSDLFEYAKEKIILMSEQEMPFNFTMLTADTHAPDGFKCEECDEQFNEQYFNVLNCSSKKIKQFVRWIQEQDFYENTTIIICGDHTSMQPDTFHWLKEIGYERTVLNIIINPAVMPEETKNKYGSTMDMFPTTLASLGVEIKGNKLGLGTNLFSNEQTIIGKYGLDYVKDELEKSSNFYNTKFLYGY